MKVIRVINGVSKEVNYPKKDLSKIEDLEYGIIFYNIIKGEVKAYDTNQYTAKWVDELTEDVDETYPHMFVCNRTFTLIEKSSATVIDSLNTSLGTHLDSNYPIYKRQSDTDELTYQSLTEDQIAYITAKKQWLYDCRIARDIKEEEFLTNGIFPSFEWEEMPTK